MSLSTFTAAFLLVVGSTCISFQVAYAQETVAAGPGTALTSGMNVESAATGLTFAIPNDFSGRYDESIAGLVLTRNDQKVVLAIFGASQATAADLGDAVIAAIAEQGIQLGLRNQTEPDEKTIRAQFDASSERGLEVLVGEVRQTKLGSGMAAVALGPPDQIGMLERLVVDVLNSAQVSPAGADKWRDAVAGRTYQGKKGSSDYDSGYGDYISTASETNYQLALCESGRYQYAYQSESYFSTAYGSGESSDADGHSGRWELIASLAGKAYLILTTDEDTWFEWQVIERSDDVLINDVPYSVAGASGC